MKPETLISKASPHLALVLDQLATSGSLDVSAARSILSSFESALTHRGGVEIGFVREEGQSFNPRASRILLILLKDGKVYDKDVLCIASERAALGDNYREYLKPEEPYVVSAAMLLDRLRHLHLEKSQETGLVYDACLKTAELIAVDFPNLSLLLGKGVERMKRNYKDV